MTCWHWSVTGVKTAGTNKFESLVECQSVLLDVINKTLEVAECSMSLVAMIDVLLDAEFLECQHTADTEQNLLFQTVLPVATIKCMGYWLVKLGVHVVVGVEQIERNTTYINTPNVCMHLIVHIRNINNQWLAILIKLTDNWERVEVLCLVVCYLLAVHAQALSEVSETIQETNSTHINVRVGCLLQVVAGEHTQTT